MKIKLFLAVACVCFMLVSCGGDEAVAGGGSDDESVGLQEADVPEEVQ